MLPEPNFPARPDEFVGRRGQIEIFCHALRQGLQAGRTASFAILGDWGIGKSSLLLKFASLCSQPSFAILPVFISASSDVRDYLRLTENMLDKFTDALLAVPTMQARLRAELRNWRFKSVDLGGVSLERESPRMFLSSGTSLLRHKLKEAWNHFLPHAQLRGAIFFLDDLQNISSISRADLALTIRDQFQCLGIENMNYSICFSAKPDYFAEAKGLADPAVRFYTKFYLEPFTLEETLDYARSVFEFVDISAKLAAWLQDKTVGHPYFLAFICKYLVTTASLQPDKLEFIWPAIFDQLGREKFRSDVSQLSAREFEFIHKFANLSENELASEHYTSKFRREYFTRLVEKSLLIRTGRGRYKLYHDLFREFLRQTE